MDAGADPLLVTNVTSNGYAMAAETAVYVADRIGGKGNVVMFVFDAFPPVQVRGVDRRRGLRQLPRHQGPRPRDPRRRRTAASPTAAPRWRRSSPPIPSRAASPPSGPPGTSRRSARCRPSRPPAAQGEGIVITGIDANPQAREAIAKGGNFEASVAQDFAGIGAATADAVARVLGGEDDQAARDLRADQAGHSANAAE